MVIEVSLKSFAKAFILYKQIILFFIYLIIHMSEVYVA